MNRGFEMSDRLAAGFDGHDTRRHHRAVEPSERRPGTEDAEGEDDDDIAHEGGTAPIAFCVKLN